MFKENKLLCCKQCRQVKFTGIMTKRPGHTQTLGTARNMQRIKSYLIIKNIIIIALAHAVS